MATKDVIGASSKTVWERQRTPTNTPREKKWFSVSFNSSAEVNGFLNKYNLRSEDVKISAWRTSFESERFTVFYRSDRDLRESPDVEIVPTLG